MARDYDTRPPAVQLVVMNKAFCKEPIHFLRRKGELDR
jgi:hypothetical protein